MDIQRRAQASRASAQQAMSVSELTCKTAAGASGTTSNTASAKPNAGGRLYILIRSVQILITF
jgi:hypothetical protein